MKTVRRLRAMASLCRQHAAYSSETRWNLLAEAEYWDRLAAQALSDLFEECTAIATNNLAHPQAIGDANNTESQSAAVALWREYAHVNPLLNAL